MLKSFIREDLQKDLDRVNHAGIPKDIVHKQGAEVIVGKFLFE